MKIIEAAKMIKAIIEQYSKNDLYQEHTGEINIKLHCSQGYVKEYEISAPIKVKTKDIKK